MKKRTLVVLAAILAFSVILTGCQDKAKDPTPPTDNNSTVNPVATFTMKSGEVFKVELYPDVAPNTVNNFIYLVNEKFYDGLTFHRIIPGFMAQGGCPKGDGTGDNGYSIKGEFSGNGFENTLKHEEGVISMARSTPPNSAGTQFFIMDQATTHLDGQYAAFGKVIEGLDKFKNLMKVELVPNEDKPVDPPVIESITIDTKGKEFSEPEKLIYTTEIPAYDKELPVVTIEMEDGKKIELELYPQIAPNTVNNFISLIKKGYYDGLTFHQILPNLFIAGGAPEAGGAGDPGYSIKSETNNLSQTAGILSMSKSSASTSAGSQFLIADMDIDQMATDYLNGYSFTVFGKVLNGAENVRALSKTKLVNQQYGAPENPPKIKKITVDTKGVDYPEPEVIKKEQ